jgi:hypothetical protein
MKLTDLKPASQVAGVYGVKSVLYGAPGCGKTPSINSAPKPVLLATEPGLLSMRGSSIPTFEAYTAPKIEEFIMWATSSAEAKAFDTIAIDSLSQLAEIILADSMIKTKHGLKAFGDMSERVCAICDKLYHMKEKHVILISKRAAYENGRQSILVDGTVVSETVMQQRPSFPGKDLNIKIPHLFDNVFYMGMATVPGQPKHVKSFRTVETPEIFARSRSGKLAEIVPADWSQVISACMS